MNEEQCIRRKRFKWNPVNDEKFLLRTPKKCGKCEEEKLKTCMEQSWGENGNDADEYKNVKIIVNVPEAEHVDVNPTEIVEEKIEE